MRGHITRKSKRSWVVVITLPRDPITRKKKQKWVTVPGTKKDAERKLRELLHQLDTGSYIEPTKMALSEYLEQWLKEYAKPNVSPRTYERYEQIIQCNIIPAIGSIPLVSLYPSHIQAFYSKARESGRYDGKGGLSARTVHHIHRVLFEALRYAVRKGLLGRNVAESVDPPRPERKEMATLDADELAELLAYTAGTPLYALFYTAAYTGLRRSELLALKWGDINLDLLTLSVERSLHQLKGGELKIGPPKNKKGRSVALSPSSAIVLRELRAEQETIRRQIELPPLTNNDLVFSQVDGSFIKPDYITSAFRRVVRSLGFKLRFHDLRHTHATLLLKAKTHPKIVQERLGHSSVSITLDTYSHAVPGMQELAAHTFDQMMGINIRNNKKENGVQNLIG